MPEHLLEGAGCDVSPSLHKIRTMREQLNKEEERILGSVANQQGNYAGEAKKDIPFGPEPFFRRTEELGLENIEEAFHYKPWDGQQVDRGAQVRDALVLAGKAILRNVPRSPLRTRALNCLVDARMLANAAITFGGRF